jgi:tol-pal system protein YbgF
MKRALGVLLISCLPFTAAGQNKQKQTYELIYQDVQLLKQQYQKLEKKVDDTADDIKVLRDQVRDLAGQFKLFQADQARNQENLRSLPTQYQAFLERLGQIESQLLKISEQLLDLKSKPAPPVEQPQETPKKDEKVPISKKPKDAGKKVEPAPEKKDPAAKLPQTKLFHQEVYNTAFTDYQRGNYDLAIDGFTTYREQFPDPEDPLADNALYMIGECFFSQKKFERAIEQYDDLIVNYPKSDAHATAYYKKGLALAELKKNDEAIAVLTLLISKHPLEEEAKKAQQKIRELKEIK